MAKSNNQSFWEAFTHSGQIEDYLNYKSHTRGNTENPLDNSIMNTNALENNIREEMRFGKLDNSGSGTDNQGAEGQRK